MDRPTPFDLVFAGLAADRFPALREALAAAGADPRDRDAFLLTFPAVSLLRDLRPDDADAGTGLDELAALAHHAYLAWDAGLHTWQVPEPTARRLLTETHAPTTAPAAAGYLQLPERLVWAMLSAPGPWEPLDGCFVHPAADGTLRVLGVFGLHESRNGFTVAEACGVPGSRAGRRDGAPLFAPSLEGGALAGLHSIVEPEELVELAGRALADPALAPAQRRPA
jgi:hypothetical protein